MSDDSLAFRHQRGGGVQRVSERKLVADAAVEISAACSWSRALPLRRALAAPSLVGRRGGASASTRRSRRCVHKNPCWRTLSRHSPGPLSVGGTAVRRSAAAVVGRDRGADAPIFVTGWSLCQGRQELVSMACPRPHHPLRNLAVIGRSPQWRRVILSHEVVAIWMWATSQVGLPEFLRRRPPSESRRPCRRCPRANASSSPGTVAALAQAMPAFAGSAASPQPRTSKGGEQLPAHCRAFRSMQHSRGDVGR